MRAVRHKSAIRKSPSSLQSVRSQKLYHPGRVTQACNQNESLESTIRTEPKAFPSKQGYSGLNQNGSFVSTVRADPKALPSEQGYSGLQSERVLRFYNPCGAKSFTIRAVIHRSAIRTSPSSLQSVRSQKLCHPSRDTQCRQIYHPNRSPKVCILIGSLGSAIRTSASGLPYDQRPSVLPSGRVTRVYNRRGAGRFHRRAGILRSEIRTGPSDIHTVRDLTFRFSLLSLSLSLSLSFPNFSLFLISLFLFLIPLSLSLFS
ncbi:unnamed protein product [Acanthosepion pharaonis]|uniref:Uncharacterized protein n=1 Tax=Acanthosepion pharaonis TaxID=158019 RepID=A0A812C0U2_ACAPH|nr:unnamed protein product [Sepia pharaonis]